MLPTAPFEGGKGHMASMEKLLSSGITVDFSSEQAAQEKAAVESVQREMEDADEANLLEEEDMHVFERQPLTDELNLVSCNLCKKPIRASQYAAHAERCRSLNTSDDTVIELDGGAGHRKPPRKARKKLLPSQDNHIAAGETERLQPLDDNNLLQESACTSGGYEDPVQGTLRGTKKVMNISEGTVVAAPKVGRPRKIPLSAPGEDGAGVGPGGAVYADTVSVPSKRPKILTAEELDLLCGVLIVQTGMMCRRALTCKLHAESSKRAVVGRRRPFEVLLQELKANRTPHGGKPHDTVVADPLPMATKVYCLRHHQRMRAVLGALFRDASNLAVVTSGGTSPDRLSGGMGEQVPPVLTLSSDQSSDLQTNGLPSGYNQKKSAKQREKKVSPLQVTQMARVKTEPGLTHSIDYSRLPAAGHSIPGVPSHQHLDNKFGIAGVATENGQLIGKGRPAQGVLALGTSIPGIQGNSLQQPLGGVPVTRVDIF